MQEVRMGDKTHILSAGYLTVPFARVGPMDIQRMDSIFSSIGYSAAGIWILLSAPYWKRYIWPLMSVCGRSVGWPVCHHFLKGHKVTLPCSYRSTCFCIPICKLKFEDLQWNESAGFPPKIALLKKEITSFLAMMIKKIVWKTILHNVKNDIFIQNICM